MRKPRCSTQPRDRIRLEHIVDAAREGMSFAAESSREDLETNRLLLHALVRCLEALRSAAGREDCERTEGLGDQAVAVPHFGFEEGHALALAD